MQGGFLCSEFFPDFSGSISLSDFTYHVDLIFMNFTDFPQAAEVNHIIKLLRKKSAKVYSVRLLNFNKFNLTKNNITTFLVQLQYNE